MKKLFAILLSLCMLCSFAFAEEEIAEANWSDFEGMVESAGIEGAFVSIADLGFKMFVPATFTSVEPTEEQKTAGVIALLAQNDAPGAVSISYQDISAYGADGFLEELTKAGAEEMEQIKLNGLTATGYNLTIEETPTANVVIDAGENKVLTFSFGPMNDEDFNGLAGIMIYSIQAE